MIRVYASKRTLRKRIISFCCSMSSAWSSSLLTASVVESKFAGK